MRFRSWSARTWAAAGLLLAAMRPGVAAEPVFLPVLEDHGAKYAAWQVDPAREDLRLYWSDLRGKVLGNFKALQDQVASEKNELLFAANAGIFDPAGQPLGLLVLNGEEKFPLNLGDGQGNFYLKPNGVFAISTKGEAFVIESGDYRALMPPIAWATQSGPLLVHGGDINPDFMADSSNRKVRSGVGVTKDGTVLFALSKQPVTFYEFAFMFLNRLHCPNALYLDGEISDFWVPGMVEKEGQHHFGPMFGLVKTAPLNNVPPHAGVTVPTSSP